MQVFENAVFLFFTHPFDVGDAVVFEGDRFKVISITLQYVKLTRLDGAAINVPCRCGPSPLPSAVALQSAGTAAGFSGALSCISWCQCT